MKFEPSPGTIGMEIELQLVDADSFDLADGILPIMDLLPGNAYVKPEFIQNTVEIASRICTGVAELESHACDVAVQLRRACDRLGLALCGAGTHPFCRRLAHVTPLRRYQRMDARTGIIGATQITFATHVHIGVASGEQAIALLRDLKPYLPLLIALSANSPFWYGYETGYASYRHRILAADRSYGIPPSFESWPATVAFFDASVRAGMFREWRDIHWDLRPRPDYGTVEVRVMDVQPTIAEATALAAFVRALAAHLMRTPPAERRLDLPRPLPWWLEKENHFQASRLALGASYVTDEPGAVRHLRDVLDVALDAVADDAEALGEADYLRRLRTTAGRRGYARQRAVQQRTGSLREVVASLARELDRELPRAPSDCTENGAAAP